MIASPRALDLDESGTGVVSISRIVKSGYELLSSTGVRGGEGDEAASEGVVV